MRDVQIGAIYGLSKNSDLAVVLLTTPDLLVNLLLAGGLSAALIPEFQRRNGDGKRRLASRALLAVGGIFLLIAVLVGLFPWMLLAILAPAYAAQPPENFDGAMRIAALAIPLAGMAGVTTALLNSERRFFIAGCGTLVFNATIILLLVLWPNTDSILMLATAVAIAGLLRFASQLVALRRYVGFTGPASPGDQSPYLLRRFSSALAASTIALLVPVVVRTAVSTTDEGNLAAFNLATKLLDLPVSVVIAAMSAVAFPMLTQYLREGNSGQLFTLYRSTIQTAVAAAIAITLPAICFAQPLASSAFGYGRMGEADVAQIAQIARIVLISMPFVAVTTVCSALLSARTEMNRLLRLTALSASVLPVMLLVGAITDDLIVFAAALPAFYLVLAVVLSKATGYASYGQAGWIDRDLIVKTAICLALTAAAAGFAGALESPSPNALTAIALAVMALSLLISMRRLVDVRV